MNYVKKCFVGVILLLSSCGELMNEDEFPEIYGEDAKIQARQRARDAIVRKSIPYAEVWTVAEILITQQLKSPSTAEWGGLFAGDWQDPREAVTELEENHYRVVGWVDSQNTFGGIVRTDFELEIKRMEDGWELVGPISMHQRQ